MRRGQGGQATIEWAALVFVVALALAATGFTVAPRNAWSFGDAILDSFLCSVLDRCPNVLEEAYGRGMAHTLHEYAPNIAYERHSAEVPVDFRRCREVDCSNGDDAAAAIDQSDVGLAATAFTRVIDRREGGGPLYLQYWLYFPESFTGGIGRKLGPLKKLWPGFHPDDWEGYQVRIEEGGSVSARATAHGGYKGLDDESGWGPWTGWYRVSGGSHAGYVVDDVLSERTTPASDLSLVPLETLGQTDGYRFAIAPPWRKDVYADPESGSS
jgi:hypothetical protein